MSLERREELSLAEAVTHLLEECRMVLPGVQALFGFQLIAVFSAGFDDKLSGIEQRIHLLALGLVAIAGALVMAPAAYHRQAGSLHVSDRFIRYAGRLPLSAMVPLMLGIALDFYLIARVILESTLISALAAVGLVCVLASLWFVLPRLDMGRRDITRP
jgi:hypothetical protein